MPTAFNTISWTTEGPEFGVSIQPRVENMPVPSLNIVDGQPVITDPTDFRSVPMLCYNIECPRRNECLRSTGSINRVGRPTQENEFISGSIGCEYFVPRTPEYINQLRKRGVNRLQSAWNS